MIDATVIEAAQQVVARCGPTQAAADELRARYPEQRFVTCSDDDVPPRLPAVASGEGYALYLIGGGEHCLALTTDPATAMGLVLAEVLPD